MEKGATDGTRESQIAHVLLAQRTALAGIAIRQPALTAAQVVPEARTIHREKEIDEALRLAADGRGDSLTCAQRNRLPAERIGAVERMTEPDRTNGVALMWPLGFIVN
jgi:hypothetical protein